MRDRRRLDAAYAVASTAGVVCTARTDEETPRKIDSPDMPDRYIEIPRPVLLIDPVTETPILDDKGQAQAWSFDFVMHKLLSNPAWGESLAALRSQDAIYRAWKVARAGVMVVAEDDWARLKQAVETPRTTVTTPTGMQVVAGFGVPPMLARHLVPLLLPIVDARDAPPV